MNRRPSGSAELPIVPDCSKPTLQGIIRGRVDPRTVINSDGWRGYHGLVDLGYGHFRVDHARDERGGPRISDRLLRWDPDQREGVWNVPKETELPG